MSKRYGESMVTEVSKKLTIHEILNKEVDCFGNRIQDNDKRYFGYFQYESVEDTSSIKYKIWTFRNCSLLVNLGQHKSGDKVETIMWTIGPQ